jgi:D-3-phosphoglycerate dehydrogenase/(S)-sulfolactate dehydrogenase
MLTPHSAAQTIESLQNMAVGVATDVVGVLHGQAPINPVNDPSEVAASRERLGKPPLDPSPWSPDLFPSAKD